MDKSQVRAARALLGWSQDELAARSGVSVATIRRQEPGTGVFAASDDVAMKIMTAFESAGVEMVEGSDLKGQGVRWSRPSDRERYAFILKSIEAAAASLRAARAACQRQDPEESLDAALASLADAVKEFEKADAYEADFDAIVASRNDGTNDGTDEN